MHHALEIEDILLHILGYCHLPELSALARTCHTFKEPALDILWGELDNLLPLAQCLPEASRIATTVSEVRCPLFDNEIFPYIVLRSDYDTHLADH